MKKHGEEGMKVVRDVLRKFYHSNELDKIEKCGMGYRDLYKKDLQSEIDDCGLDEMIKYLSWLIMQKGKVEYRKSDDFDQIIREKDHAFERLSRYEVDHGTNW